jgi:hypothetical protein
MPLGRVSNIFCTILTCAPLRQFRTRTEGLWSRLGGSVDNGRRYGKTQAAMTLATNSDRSEAEHIADGALVP